MNNDLLDTYQLKSLDGLLETKLEKIAIIQLQEKEGKTKETKRQLYLTAKKHIQNQGEKNSSVVAAEVLPGYHTDNFCARKHYDRVIRCIGFRFNFSIFDRYRFA